MRVRIDYPETSKCCSFEHVDDGLLSGARASICVWSTRTVSATTAKEGTTTRTPARTACSTWATSSPRSCSSASTGPRRRTSSGETEPPSGPIASSSSTNADFCNAFNYHLSDLRINMRIVSCRLLNCVKGQNAERALRPNSKGNLMAMLLYVFLLFG